MGTDGWGSWGPLGGKVLQSSVNEPRERNGAKESVNFPAAASRDKRGRASWATITVIDGVPRGLERGDEGQSTEYIHIHIHIPTPGRHSGIQPLKKKRLEARLGLLLIGTSSFPSYNPCILAIGIRRIASWWRFFCWALINFIIASTRVLLLVIFITES